ncbi:MAG: MATE family efflux transporter [Firmicutes bacterium]|nr:MATE family efflux transporter [Candidatus Fermentithermobacillaceae bacterium]
MNQFEEAIPLDRQHSRQDFTEGSIPRHLITFAIPMFLGNALQALYNTVDSIWVGQFLGRNALAAVSVSFPVIFATIAVAMGITMATTALVAQHAGAKDMPMVRKTVTNSLLITAALGVVSSIVGVSLRIPLLRLIRTPPEAIAQAQSYLGIVMAGITATFFYNAVSAILRGLGDSRTPLIFLTYATVLNIILDPLMIFGVWPFPRMGVAGAALATVIAQALSAFLGIRHMAKTGLIKWEREEWALDGQIVKQTFGIGLPAGIQQIIVSMGMLTVTSLVNRFGAVVTAAFGVGGRLDQFVTMPAMTVGLSVTALVGQNLGARKFDRVREVVRSSVLLTVAITGAISIIVLAIPQVLLRMFTSDGAVIVEGTKYLRTLGFAYIPMGLMFTLAGILRGAGDTVPSMIISLVTLWGVRVPAALFLSRIFGSEGLWLGMAVSPVMGSLLNYAYYLSGRWKNRVLTRSTFRREDLPVPDIQD